MQAQTIRPERALATYSRAAPRFRCAAPRAGTQLGLSSRLTFG